MTDFNVSMPRGTTVFQASADSMGPGAVIKSKAKIDAPNKVTRNKGVTPSKEGKIMSRSFSTKNRKKLAKTGAAEPDGSYPIKNAKDLANARKDLARTGNKPSDVVHVNKRAKALGLTAGGPGSGRHSSFGKYNSKVAGKLNDGRHDTSYTTNTDKSKASDTVRVISDPKALEGTQHIIVKHSSDDGHSDESPLPTRTTFSSPKDASNHLSSVYGIKHSFGK